MKVRGRQLIWTPPYVPSFKPMELSGQHGEQYVSFRYITTRSIDGVWDEIREGWHGDPEGDARTGDWKPVDCANQVAHASKEVDKGIQIDAVLTVAIVDLTCRGHTRRMPPTTRWCCAQTAPGRRWKLGFWKRVWNLRLRKTKDGAEI